MRNQFNKLSLVMVALAALGAAGCQGEQSAAFTAYLDASDGEETAAGIAASSNGHVTIAGHGDGRFPGSTHAGATDAVVVQFDDSGAVRWTRQFGTANADLTRAIAADGAGNVYVAGITTGSFEGFTNQGQIDAFVTKLDDSGAILWTRQLGTSGNDALEGMATDKDGNVYVAGTTLGSFPGFTNAGYHDMFLLKLDGDGELQWVQQLGSNGGEMGLGVATDSSGHVILVGYSDGSFPGFANMAGGLVIKYDGNGERQWTRPIHPAPWSSSVDVVTDGDGNICVVGDRSNGGGRVLTVNKLDPDGERLWASGLGRGRDTEMTWGGGVAVDGEGNVIVTGYTGESLPGQTNAGETDMVIARFNAAGEREWLTQYGTSGLEHTAGVSATSSGSLFVVGHARSGGFAPGDTNLFLMKFDAAGGPLP